MRIGLVSPYDLSSPGGVQAQVIGLAKALRAAGDEAFVIGPGLPEGEDGVDLGRAMRVPGNGSMVPISLSPSAGSKIRDAAVSADVLHVHEPLMPLASLAANRAGPPVVATFHADPSPLVRKAYARSGRLMRSALGRAKIVTAVSRTAASALPPELDCVIVPNGVDVGGMTTELDRIEHQVVFLGRDEPRKGLDVLLEAWPTVLEHVPDATLVAIGPVRRTSGIEWMGRVDEQTKCRLLAGSAAYVAPHLGGESFGIVLVEAMAVGTPVIASDLPAFRDVAQDAARYAPPGDAGQLAGNIVDLLLDPKARESLGRIGLERSKAFDWPVVATAYRELYDSVIS